MSLNYAIYFGQFSEGSFRPFSLLLPSPSTLSPDVISNLHFLPFTSPNPLISRTWTSRHLNFSISFNKLLFTHNLKSCLQSNCKHFEISCECMKRRKQRYLSARRRVDSVSTYTSIFLHSRNYVKLKLYKKKICWAFIFALMTSNLLVIFLASHK